MSRLPEAALFFHPSLSTYNASGSSLPRAASSFNIFLIVSDNLLIPGWLVRTARLNANGTIPDDMPSGFRASYSTYRLSHQVFLQLRAWAELGGPTGTRLSGRIATPACIAATDAYF
jgi:hypothetical protein